MLVKIILSVFIFLFSILTMSSLGTSVLAENFFLVRRIITPQNNVPNEEARDLREDLETIDQELQELIQPEEIKDEEINDEEIKNEEINDEEIKNDIDIIDFKEERENKRITNPLHNVPSEKTRDLKEDLKIIDQELQELIQPEEINDEEIRDNVDIIDLEEEEEKIGIVFLQKKIRTVNQKLEEVVKIEEDLEVPVLDEEREEIREKREEIEIKKKEIDITPLQEEIIMIDQELGDIINLEEDLEIFVLDEEREKIRQNIREKKKEIDITPLQEEIIKIVQKLGDIINLEEGLETLILDEEREKIRQETIIEWNQIIEDYEELIHRGREEILPDEKERIKRRAYEITRKLQITTIEEVKRIESFEDPREKGIALGDIFKITEITVKETFIRDDGVEDIKSLIIRGTGLPNSMVVIFIYSTPIVVSTRTDANGNWSYVLERELEDGSHKIYVASVDNTGRILARSEPLPFVKEGIALEIDFPEPVRNEIHAFDFLDRNIIIVIVGLFVLVITLTIIFIGITLKEKKNL